METNRQELEALQDIRNMMERSSRFISLSGWSGVTAGICALIGSYFAYKVIGDTDPETTGYTQSQISSVLIICALTFAGALFFSFIFTYIRSKRTYTPIWGNASKRLIWSVAVPIISGGIFLWRMIELGIYGLLIPGSLIFYGIALFCASKQTLKEIKYLGYAEILLGVISLWYMGHGPLLWAIGFGVLHIVYGLFMWWRYERK